MRVTDPAARSNTRCGGVLGAAEVLQEAEQRQALDPDEGLLRHL